MKKLIAMVTFIVIMVVTTTIGIKSYLDVQYTSYKNALRYAEEHNCICYANGPRIAYVFSDYSIIGRDVMYKMYKD